MQVIGTKLLLIFIFLFTSSTSFSFSRCTTKLSQNKNELGSDPFNWVKIPKNGDDQQLISIETVFKVQGWQNYFRQITSCYISIELGIGEFYYLILEPATSLINYYEENFQNTKNFKDRTQFLKSIFTNFKEVTEKYLVKYPPGPLATTDWNPINYNLAPTSIGVVVVREGNKNIRKIKFNPVYVEFIDKARFHRSLFDQGQHDNYLDYGYKNPTTYYNYGLNRYALLVTLAELVSNYNVYKSTVPKYSIVFTKLFGTKDERSNGQCESRICKLQDVDQNNYCKTVVKFTCLNVNYDVKLTSKMVDLLSGLSEIESNITNKLLI
jgi:hypothetical protein